MMRCFLRGLLAVAWLAPAVLLGLDLTAPDGPPRMVNGTVVEGTVSEATLEGLLVQTPKGPITYPWKYLSPGTRYRFERPMLEEMKAKAEAEAKEAARKAAAAKKAAEAKAAKEAAAKEAAAKKAAEKAAKAAAGTNAPPAATTNAPAASATNAPAGT